MAALPEQERRQSSLALVRQLSRPWAADALPVHCADFKAKVPIVGGKVEGFAAPIILSYIDAEEKTGQAWAQEHSPRAD